MPRFATCLTCLAFLTPPAAAQFTLRPAVAVEAEDLTVTSGWKVVKNGEGNYMVDMVGFNHISGERLLHVDARDSTASAYIDLDVPEAGRYRLWLRYEYPPFCEARFRVVVEQGGKAVCDAVMGKKDSLRYAFGEAQPKAQHDPSWGPEGLVDEVVTIPDLKKGKARLSLKAVAQPQVAGVAAARNIDLIYLTRDTEDAWRGQYSKQTKLYPILDAFRDSRGPRWEVRFTNRGTSPANFRITHVYNRIPWGHTDPAEARGVAAGGVSGWLGLRGQDTAHFGAVRFDGPTAGFDVELRPAGGQEAAGKFSGTGQLHVYLPPYPNKGERPTTPEAAIDAILADLKKHKAPGKSPTKPLCYGGWMPLGQDNAYGRQYAALYAALGLRSLHPAHSGPAVLKNLQAAGVPATKSWMVMSYRNPPTPANINRARVAVARDKMEKYLRFFDYGDEIHFSEWIDMVLKEDAARLKASGKRGVEEELLRLRWLAWLKANRPKAPLQDYWLKAWGAFNFSAMRPDSSAAAAQGNPRLYIDSLLFYEEAAIGFAAAGAKAARAALGADVLCGANYSCHPFYYPHSTMYIKWFRGGAADLGRHSEYFWQLAQPGPMVNGYIAEHFRAGMRDNPTAVLRQYTMPHAPGNTDGNFLRSAFSHLAHGATMLDFFGVGLNECFTENHIDHRAVNRFRALRDLTHCVGFAEDRLPDARAVPSEVALLVSESTERWDYAGIATDRAGHDLFGPNFRRARLHFHLERLGLWKALTFLGSTPDLLTEEDVNAKRLKGYRLLVLVGDHWGPGVVPAVEAWVKGGGVVMGTAAAGLRDSYGQPNDAWAKLAGIKNVKTAQRTTFLRPRQELAFLEPLGSVVGKGWTMPRLATEQSAEPAEGTKVLATFKGGQPAVFERAMGKGRVIHVASHPGLAYLWSALCPPEVPDRGPGTHRVPERWDAGARVLIKRALETAGVTPAVVADPGLIDARLLTGPKGYLLPVANYHERVGQKVKLTVRVGKKVAKVASAYHGELKHEQAGDSVTFTLPALGYGDLVRIEN